MATLYLIRHAHAGDRRSWDGSDQERPLSDKGARQAKDLARVLADAKVARVLSSPATRCTQTVQPLAAEAALEVEPERVLREGANPAKSLALLEECARAAGSDGAVAACTHGDVMPEVVRLATLRGATIEGPSGNNKASWWALDHDGERFTTARWHPPA